MKRAFAVLAFVVLVAAGLLPPSRQSLGATCVPTVGPGIAPPASVPAGIAGFHAAWYGQSGYQSLCPGQAATAVVAFYNSGSEGWVSGRMGEVAYLGTWGPEPGQDMPSAVGGDGQLGSPATGWPRYNRVAVQPADYVGPGQVAWFQFSLRAPMTPGTYQLGLRPLIEGATWMEDYGVFWVFTVMPDGAVGGGGGGGGGGAPPPPPPGATPPPGSTPTPAPTPTTTPTAPPAGGAGFVGDAGIEGTPDPSAQGLAEATKFTATTGGSVTSLSIYLDGSNQATSFALGLYSDSGAAPGSLLAQGSRSGAQNGVWNTVGISSTTVTAGAAYWVARLSTAGGNLITRVNNGVTNSDRVHSSTGLSSLPSSFVAAGADYRHITSLYAGTTAPSTPGPTPTPTPTPTATPTAPPGAFTCTEILGFSQTGNWWSLQRAPNDAFESVVDGSRYQIRAASGGAVWKWFNPSIDPTFDGWSMSPTSPCTSASGAPDRVVMDITESFWIGDPCGTHTFDDCRAGSDTSVGRVTQDVIGVVAYIRAHYPSVRQIILKPLVGGPSGGPCFIPGVPPDDPSVLHEIRGARNSPQIATAIANAIPSIPAGIEIVQSPTFTVRDCTDFYGDTQYVGHLNPATDAKPRIGQQIGAWFAARP